jgi:hypothetical protein
LQPHGLAPGGGTGPVRGVTISRQSGCGGDVFAEELAACLQARLPQGGRRRTAFDRSFVEVVLQDHHLPAYLQRYFGQNVDDPLLYHFVINTDWVALKDAAKIVGIFAPRGTAPNAARNSPTTVVP